MRRMPLHPSAVIGRKKETLMSEKRVVVTGMGTINSLGKNVEEFWTGLENGASGISRIERFNTEVLISKVAGQIKDYDPLDYFEKRALRRLSVFISYGLIAAKEAVADSGLDFSSTDPYRCGCITGSGIGGIYEIEEQVNVMNEKGLDRVSPFLIIRMINDMLPGRLSMAYNLKGANYSTTTACASSAHAILESYNTIKRNELDIIVTGGAEAPITQLSLAAFCSLHALSTGFNDNPTASSRPFDKDRDGFVIAEGSGILILEEMEHAKKRGAKIYGEIVGYGNTADAHHDTAPAPRAEGGRRAMAQAIKMAGIGLDQISWINAHGTSTKANDLNETLGIKDLFKDLAYKIPVSSIKSMLGHSLGAAAAIEAIASMKAIEKGIIPPTINYTTPDEEIDLDYVPNTARDKALNYVLSNSFGFGGHNGVLLFGKI